MKMELSQADSAKRLNVSRTVSEINIKPKHLCPEDMFHAELELQHLQETVLSLFQPEREEGFLFRNLRVQFTLERDSGHLLIGRERSTRFYQSNTVERHSYRGGGIRVWAGISLGCHTDFYVFQGGTFTAVIYRDEILDPCVYPYAGAIGNDFILMDDNARPHRAVIAEKYLEGLRLDPIEWPAQSPDLNPIKHL
ncbi:transposable element Tcb2 transposase [Trichonephila clavipes]|nr:transposable element Tcb2 transposase [Trichonephila clavipes]